MCASAYYSKLIMLEAPSYAMFPFTPHSISMPFLICMLHQSIFQRLIFIKPSQLHSQNIQSDLLDVEIHFRS